MRKDPLSDIIRSMNLSGAVFLNGEFTAPWAITSHVTEEDCQPYMPIPRQLIAYHVVVEGEMIVSLEQTGRNEYHLAKAGDVVFLPDNPLHKLSSSKGLSPVCGDDILLPAAGDGLVQIRHGGGGKPTRILCGFMASGSGSTPLFAALPQLMIIGIDSLETRRWIEASILLAAREFSKGRMYGGGMVSGLCQLLLTEALRVHIDQSQTPESWLRGMAHPRVARALAQIHDCLSDAPSIEALATNAGMSRSAFVDRFTEVMGLGPRRYILMQRMELAKNLLEDGLLNVAQIAADVGYDAPEAFSRAFKREVGLSPADWKRSIQSARSH